MSSPPSQTPCVLALAQTLHSQLITSFAPPLPANDRAPTTHLLHPLSSIPPQAVPESRQRVKDTFTSLRSACAAFSSQLLDPVTTGTTTTTTTTTNARPVATEKLLSLLKETAGSQAVLIAHGQDAKRAAEALKSRRPNLPVLSYETLAGFEGGGAGGGAGGGSGGGGGGGAPQRTLYIIERIASALGLASFRETGSHAIEEEGTGVKKMLDVVTLSLGAKVMVIDVEVDSEVGKVIKTKFSYVLDSQHEDDEVARELTGSLRGIEKVLELDEEAEVELRLQRFRAILKELKRLDEMTEESTVDCFSVAAKMARAIASVLVPERTGGSHLSLDAHGLQMQETRNPHPSILYHATPSVQLDPEWASACQSANFSSVSDLSGINTVRVSLEKPSTSVVPPAEYVDITKQDKPSSINSIQPSFHRVHATTSHWPHFLPTDAATCPTFVARFEPSVPITKSTGRRIEAVLKGEEEQVSVDAAPVGARLSRTARGQGPEPTWFEDLLISKNPPSVTRFSGTDSFNVEFDDVPVPLHFSLAEPGTNPGFLCSDVRFQSPAQLFRVIEILKEQHFINDLSRSVLQDRFKVSPKPPPTKAAKKRKVESMTLDELFEDSPIKNVPVSIQYSRSSQASPPSLLLSLPSPHKPPSSSYPITLTLTPKQVASPSPTSSPNDAVQVSVDVHLGTDDESEKTRVRDLLPLARLGEIVQVAGDLGLLVRWVVKRLGVYRGEEKGVVEMEVDLV
ncbi:hypothetical protein T439DRAFT_381486 [Meredithblackwellia eburnea MCA 4105]